MLQNLRKLVSLDSYRFYSRGYPLNPHNLLAYLNPSPLVKTLVSEKDGTYRGFIQLRKNEGDHRAQLNYLLANEQALGVCPELIEGAVRTAGSWGAHALLCDLPAQSGAFTCFKQNGFVLWAKQKVYRLDEKRNQKGKAGLGWRTWTNADVATLEKLYREIVPALFQNVEQLSRKNRLGLILKNAQNECLAFADYDEGPKGVWLQPFIKQGLNEPEKIHELIGCLHLLSNRPVYIAIRSYQAWAESLVERAGAELVSEELLLVKFLAASVPLAAVDETLALENRGVSSSLPLH